MDAIEGSTRPGANESRPIRYLRAVRGWIRGTARDYIVRLFEKADGDNVFLLASGLTFSIIVAAVPLLFVIVALLSVTLQQVAAAAGVEPIDQLREYVDIIVPFLGQAQGTGGGPTAAEQVVQWVLDRAPQIGAVSVVAFIWFSTRLFGALRAALREVFDVRQGRGIIEGKLFDAQMVVIASVLVILNIGITIVLNIGKARSFEALGLSPPQVGVLETLWGTFTALLFIFLLFLLIYKYVPAGRVPWRMALIAATFTAILWELLKLGFGFYLTRFADYGSVYGNVATLVVVIIWIYYVSIFFILGGEVAQVWEMRRVRRKQREVLG